MATLDDGRLVLAGPSNLVKSPAEQRFLLLPHPRSHAPAYFVVDEAKAYELQAVTKDRRSWMLNGSVADGSGDANDASQGWVLQDGSMHLLLPLDPIFLLLPLLDGQSTAFVPLDDLFEAAASSHYASRAKAYNVLAAKNEGVHALDEAEGTWDDILAFGRSDAARQALKRCCDEQAMNDSTVAYRPSIPKLRAVVTAKLIALRSSIDEQFPSTLGRTLAKRLDFNATEEQIAVQRQRVARDVLAGWLSDEWIKMLLDD